MSAWTFCSKQDVTDINTVAEASLLDSWSESAEGMIREHLGQSHFGLSEETFVEYRNGDGSYRMRLRHAPVASVASVVVDGVVIGASDYYVGFNFIELLDGLLFTSGVRNVVITYNAGGGEITPDVRLCAATMLVAFYNYYGRSGADASLKWSTMMDDGRDHTRAGEAGPGKRVGFLGHLNTIMQATLRARRIKIA